MTTHFSLSKFLFASYYNVLVNNKECLAGFVRGGSLTDELLNLDLFVSFISLQLVFVVTIFIC